MQVSKCNLLALEKKAIFHFGYKLNFPFVRYSRAKGVGEISLVTVPAAICNAIARAVNINLRQLPMTSERVFEALDLKKKSNAT